jgi:hypothetical protein
VFSPAYGEAVPIVTLYCSRSGNLPFSIETVIDLT